MAQFSDELAAPSVAVLDWDGTLVDTQNAVFFIGVQ